MADEIGVGSCSHTPNPLPWSTAGALPRLPNSLHITCFCRLKRRICSVPHACCTTACSRRRAWNGSWQTSWRCTRARRGRPYPSHGPRGFERLRYSRHGDGVFESKLAGILRLADAFDQDMEARRRRGWRDSRAVAGRCGGRSLAGRIDQCAGAVDASAPDRSSGILARASFPTSCPAHLEPNARPTSQPCRCGRGGEPRSGHRRTHHAAGQFGAVRIAYADRHTLQAIGRLGFATSQKVIISAALRPVFGSPKLDEVWQHSLQVADLSEQLACHTGAIDPAEAYLAGLVHDVGRSCYSNAPLRFGAASGLTAGGCPEVYAENLLLRTDHAALGAQIAAGWRLPETMVSAIRQHHRPESPLAYLLYAAEYLSGSEEDLPSIVRLESSLKGIGLDWDDLQTARSRLWEAG